MKIRGSNSGAVLVVVLGILALLTLIAVSFVFATRMSLRASEAYMRTVAASDIAEAGLANAIAVLKADKIYRTGDPLDPTVPITETFDSLVDKWRTEFTAPVVIEYTEPPVSEAGLAAGDTITNVISDPEPSLPYPDRYLATAEVISVDTANNRLYLNSISTGMWQAGAPGDRVVEQGGAFDATISAVSKPDEVDLDGDGTNDAIWSNYYDESGDLMGRYAVLVQDESSKINVNVAGNIAQIAVAAGNVYSPANTDYQYADNEGWSPFEIGLQTGLSITENQARQIVLYRNGLYKGGQNQSVTWPWTKLAYDTSDPGDSPNRVVIGGQGDLYAGSNPRTAADFGDDDDDYNRFFYGNDGIDNDGDGVIDGYDGLDNNNNAASYRSDGVDNDIDGLIDEGDEGIDEWEERIRDEGTNDPDEFRPLRPYRTNALDYNRLNDDDSDADPNIGDPYTDETNEADDQPIFTLEQLTDSEGVNLGNAFLSDAVSASFDGVWPPGDIERRHVMSTNSVDRNLNKDGEIRVNPNFATPTQILGAVRGAFPLTGTGDTNGYERPDLRNIQAAVNIYDYADRNQVREGISDAAGNIFAGGEAIRINEVMVRPATSIYEAEILGPDASGYWRAASDPLGLNLNLLLRQGQGAGSPRGAEDYLNNPGFVGNTTSESSLPVNIVLPDPPFTSVGGPNGNGTYPFKLRMRVRSDGAAAPANLGFEVWINAALVNPALGINSFLGNNTTGRWATFNTPPAPPPGVNNWYIEEAIVTLNGGGANNSIQFVKPGVPLVTDPQDTVDVDWFYFTQEPDCEWIELVNLGSETVNVNNWKIVSEYTKDQDESAGISYYKETYELTLAVPATSNRIDNDLGISPVDRTTDPYLSAPQGSPKFVVFAVDRFAPEDGVEAVGYGGAGSTNGIEYTGTFVGGLFNSIMSTAAVQMVYQLNSISNIYTGWIDFFGNEPFNDPADDTNPLADARNTPADSADDVNLAVGIGQISLYDANGNLVDKVTYDAGNVREAFSSLQREYPASPGDRLNGSNNFKMRSYTASGANSEYNVLSDGAYDDWKPQNGEAGSSTPARASHNLTSSRYALVKYASTTASGTPVNEAALALGSTITNSSKNNEQAAVEYINKIADYMLLDGGTSGRPARWQASDTIRSGAFNSRIRFIDAGAAMFDLNASNEFVLSNGRVKNESLSSPGELSFVPYFNEYVAAVRYSSNADDSGLAVGDIITNTSLTPSQTATILSLDTTENYLLLQGIADTDFVSNWYGGQIIGDGASFSTRILYLKPEHSISGDQIEYYAVVTYSGADGNLAVGNTITNTSKTETAEVTALDTGNNAMILRGDPINLVSRWSSGNLINNGGTFSEAVASSTEVRKTADTRGLADYFTTSLFDLEASSAAASDIADPANPATDWSATTTNWPTSTDPTTYETTANAVDFRMDWDEDDGIRNGTFDLYLVVESGTVLDAVQLDSAGAAIGGSITNAIPTVGIYTVGGATYRIGTIYCGPVTITDGTLRLRITNRTPAGDSARFMRAILTPAAETLGRVNANTASDRVLQGLPGMTSGLATSLINARNIEAFESIGDVYRVSQVNENFTETVFKNISNLVTTRSDLYKIIVLGESATDANKNGIIENTEITGSKKLEITYQR
jgi:hypothetical protein